MADEKFISLKQILSKDAADLEPVEEGIFKSESLGAIPFTSLTLPEHKQAKKDCVTYVKRGKQMVPDIDEDRLMQKVIVTAVDKDQRSDFTFASKELLKHLGITTAEQAVQKLLKPGEIYDFAMAIQDKSGFGDSDRVDDETADAIKN